MTFTEGFAATPHAFGLPIVSEIPLPSQLSLGSVRADAAITVVRGIPDQLADVEPTVLGHRFRMGWALLDFPGTVRIGVEGGRRVVVQLLASSDPRYSYGGLLGPALGVALLQRGATLLHACGVIMADVVVAVAAASGGGKSTLAAWMHLRGYPVVTDDVLAMPAGDASRVVPAFPLVRLWPEAVTMLGLDPASLDVIEPDVGKLALDVSSGFASAGGPLGAVLVLERRAGAEETRILSGREALMAVIENSYGVSALHASGGLGRHLQVAAEIASVVPVVRVRVSPRRPIAEVGELILETAALVHGRPGVSQGN